jgi:asparagine synthase (glutamine-hydrolysing)
MCGVFGFYLKRPLTESDVAAGKRYLGMLHHRGPDNTGVHTDVDAGLFLGHKRLSIIDTSADGHQPMARHGRVISYNGEIYNYVELADQLRGLGARFTTSSDTEVLLESWLNWGPQALDRFDGMFAFALFDQGKLHLATDPFGEKPMYLVETAEGIYFSSEPHPLVEMLGLTPEFSGGNVAEFLSQGYLSAPSTGYKNLVRMEPATHLTFTLDTEGVSRKYWLPSTPEPHSGRVREISERDLDRIVETLAESLKIRFRADVPSVLFLSSGIDSALVATLAVRELNHDIPALTVGFPGKSVADESEQASAIAQALGLSHEVIQSQDDGSEPPHVTLQKLYGEANANLTALAAHQMSQVAVKQAKVAISGLGGDEMFFGYGRHEVFYRWRRWLRTGGLLRKAASIAHRVRSRGRSSILGDILASDEGIGLHHFRNHATWEWLLQIPDQQEWSRRPLPSSGLRADVESRHFDMIDMMPGSFIPAMERASMRTSLEVRTPFLSRSLHDLIATLDPRAFMAFGQKSVQKRILARYLPERLFSQRKIGFNYPNEAYLAGVSKPDAVLGIDQSLIDDAWSRRSERYWSTLATRMSVLNGFAGHTEIRRPRSPKP